MSTKNFPSIRNLAWLISVIVVAFCLALLFVYGFPKNLNDVASLATSITGVLTIATLLLTLYTVNLQRRDIEFQRQELIKASRAQLRTLHSELLIQALNDPELLAVWMSESAHDPKWFKQSVYINQIFSHWQTLLEIGEISVNELELLLTTYMSKPAFRKFWEEVRDLRSKASEINNNSSRQTFHHVAEEAYHRTVST